MARFSNRLIHFGPLLILLIAGTGCTQDGVGRPRASFASDTLGLSQQAIEKQPILALCSSCHLAPNPAELPKAFWGHIIEAMKLEMQRMGKPLPADAQFQTITDYYVQHSPEVLPELLLPRPDEQLKLQAIELAPQVKLASEPYIPPAASFIDVTNINITDLDRDGHPDALVTRRWGALAPDAETPSIVQWHYRENGKWQHRELAALRALAHTEVVDHNGDGHLDIVAADLGDLFPSPNNNGKVVLLENDGTQQFKQRVLLENVGRIADARPGDFDGDGDLDYAVAVFGFFTPGQVCWLENTGSLPFKLHTLTGKSGAMQVVPADLNADGHLDLLTLITQEHEEIVAFLNDGKGVFKSQLIFKAPTPLYGSSGMDLTDLDQDGDMDILLTNGDSVNRALAELHKRPYHGVQWLENQGGLQFVYHDIARLYGAYRAVAGDLDGDGDRDIVALSAIKIGADHYELIWLENDGKQNFTPRGISRNQDHFGVTAALGDMNEDGRLDILTGGLMGLRLWTGQK
jgi:hypothetical protein